MITNNYQNESNSISKEFDLFTKIWFSPRIVFEYIDSKKYNNYVILLIIIGGINHSLEKAITKNFGDKTSLLGILILSILLGGLLGWISYYIYAALISWAGKFLDGKANTDSIFRILAYSFIPQVISLFILILQIITFEDKIFKSDEFIFANTFSLILYHTFSILQLICNFWTLILFVTGISVVQKFSIANSIFNIVLPFLIIILPILLIILLVNSF